MRRPPRKKKHTSRSEGRSLFDLPGTCGMNARPRLRPKADISLAAMAQSLRRAPIKVRLTVGEKTFTERFEFAKDPRISITQRELHKQYEPR